MMLPQRVRVAESRAKNKSSNGPLRVQSNAKAKYSATRGHASVAGDMSVSRKVHGFTVNQGGTTDNVYSSLTENISVKDFIFYR